MKKIEYPARGSNDFIDLIEHYKAIFDSELSSMESNWLVWKQSNDLTSMFPETVEELLVADVHLISDVYRRFKSLGYELSPRDKRLRALDNIFDYKSVIRGKIADFFIERAEQLHISSCYYCDTAYINVYNTNKRQFDIDHYLPQEKCPILALSLFNFVPSCQVCNSRIKRAKVIGNYVVDYETFNPAGEDYSFDKNVSIRLRMNQDIDCNFKNSGAFYIHFHCKNNFQKTVNFFHLEERYEFHKLEAIRIKELKSKYPPSAIRKIAALLGFSVARVKEDLFHEQFIKNNQRCFAKLTSDMLK